MGLFLFLFFFFLFCFVFFFNLNFSFLMFSSFRPTVLKFKMERVVGKSKPAKHRVVFKPGSFSYTPVAKVSKTNKKFAQTFRWLKLVFPLFFSLINNI